MLTNGDGMVMGLSMYNECISVHIMYIRVQPIAGADCNLRNFFGRG